MDPVQSICHVDVREGSLAWSWRLHPVVGASLVLSARVLWQSWFWGSSCIFHHAPFAVVVHDVTMSRVALIGSEVSIVSIIVPPGDSSCSPTGPLCAVDGGPW